MTRYRGDNFIVVDDDAFGDGETDGTQPLDTWLCNITQGNIMHLATGLNSFNISPITVAGGSANTSTTGDKAYAAVSGWIQLISFEMPVTKKFRGVEIHLAANVRNEGVSPGSTDIDYKITIGNETSTPSTITETDNAGTRTYTQRRIVFQLSQASKLTVGSLVTVNLWVRSRHVDENAATDTGDVSILAEADTVGWFTDSGGIDNGSFDVQVLSLGSAYSAYDDDVFDMIGNAERGMVLHPQPSRLNTVNFARQYMSYISIKGAAVRPLYDVDSVPFVDKASVAPNIILNAAPGQLAAQGVIDLYSRPMVKHVGPVGVIDNTYEDVGDEPSFGIDYPWMWPFVLGSASATNLIDESIWIDSDDPVIMVVMWNLVSQRRAQGVGVGSSLWDYTVTIDQMDAVLAAQADPSTDSTQYGTDSITMNHTVQTSSLFSSSPLLKTLYLLQGGASTFTEQNYTLKEGTLYETDEVLLEKVVISVPLTNFDTEKNRPVRVQVSAVLNEATSYATGFGVTTSDLRLTNIRHTIIEYPQ